MIETIPYGSEYLILRYEKRIKANKKKPESIKTWISFARIALTNGDITQNQFNELERFANQQENSQ